MTCDWNELEGASLAGRYWLKRCLSARENDAWYLTRFGASADAAVRVVCGDAPGANRILEAWREALGIEHPHLVRMLDAGCVEAGGVNVIYAVCEYPDDFLGSALAERPLSTDEADGVLAACLSALGFLHAKGLVHRAVAADRVVAVGERIKLPSETIRRAGERATPAEDMQSLGAMLVEILTRERPVAGGEVPRLPEPFATIVRNTLKENPAERWSVKEVEAHLHPPAQAEAAAVAAAAVAAEVAPPEACVEPRSEPCIEPRSVEPRTPAPAAHGQVMKWVPLAGTLAAIALGALFLPHPKEPAAKPSVQAVSAPVRPPASGHTAERMAPAAPTRNVQAQAGRAAIWRVVVYEYAKRSAAEHRAHRLNAKRRTWHAQVFAPRGDSAPYFVVLGGWMTLPEAERLKKQARAAGLPRDTFVRNFAR